MILTNSNDNDGRNSLNQRHSFNRRSSTSPDDKKKIVTAADMFRLSKDNGGGGNPSIITGGINGLSSSLQDSSLPSPATALLGLTLQGDDNENGDSEKEMDSRNETNVFGKAKNWMEALADRETLTNNRINYSNKSSSYLNRNSEMTGEGEELEDMDEMDEEGGSSEENESEEQVVNLRRSQKLSDHNHHHQFLNGNSSNPANNMHMNNNEYSNESADGVKFVNSTVEILKNQMIKKEDTPKKKRTRTTPEQLKILQQAFEEDPMPNAVKRGLLAKRLGMTGRAVQIWFQNRRAKGKLDQKRSEAAAASFSNSGSGTLIGNVNHLTGNGRQCSTPTTPYNCTSLGKWGGGGNNNLGNANANANGRSYSVGNLESIFGLGGHPNQHHLSHNQQIIIDGTLHGGGLINTSAVSANTQSGSIGVGSAVNNGSDFMNMNIAAASNNGLFPHPSLYHDLDLQIQLTNNNNFANNLKNQNIFYNNNNFQKQFPRFSYPCYPTTTTSNNSSSVTSSASASPNQSSQLFQLQFQQHQQQLQSDDQTLVDNNGNPAVNSLFVMKDPFFCDFLDPSIISNNGSNDQSPTAILDVNDGNNSILKGTLLDHPAPSTSPLVINVTDCANTSHNEDENNELSLLDNGNNAENHDENDVSNHENLNFSLPLSIFEDKKSDLKGDKDSNANNSLQDDLFLNGWGKSTFPFSTSSYSANGSNAQPQRSFSSPNVAHNTSNVASSDPNMNSLLFFGNTNASSINNSPTNNHHGTYSSHSSSVFPFLRRSHSVINTGANQCNVGIEEDSTLLSQYLKVDEGEEEEDDDQL